MNLTEQQLKEILVDQNYVSQSDYANAEEYSKKSNSYISTVDYLLSEGIVTRDLLGQAISEWYHIPYADLNTNKPSKDLVLRVPDTFAKGLHAVPYKIDGNTITLATDDPGNPDLMPKASEVLPDFKVEIAYSMPIDIDNILLYYRKPLETRFNKIIEGQQRIAPEILSEIIEDGAINRASDIHFEPQEKDVIIRFRVDGILQEAGHLPKEYYENVLNRIKILAHLRIDEHFSAQDGAIRYQSEDLKVDLRVSITPTLDGEKVVMRLLSEYVKKLSFSSLGLSEKSEAIISRISKMPFGMMLTVGPTGSGKTTTLYALLRNLNSPTINITTIEDPVEYKIAGVNQIQVNAQTNLTFAEGLRSIVRQDPDVILVGEIRDYETADIAVNAALTGHLLLSTFHSNDAATAIPRLLEMGIEPFLLASTLKVIIGQRLVRKICDRCRYSVEVDVKDLPKHMKRVEEYLPGKKVTFYKAKGCEACNNTGYSGRVAIFEIIESTEEMQELMLKQPTSNQIWSLAEEQGAVSLFEDGIVKVLNGATTLEELVRVAPIPIKIKSSSKKQ